MKNIFISLIMGLLLFGFASETKAANLTATANLIRNYNDSLLKPYAKMATATTDVLAKTRTTIDNPAPVTKNKWNAQGQGNVWKQAARTENSTSLASAKSSFDATPFSGSRGTAFAHAVNSAYAKATVSDPFYFEKLPLDTKLKIVGSFSGGTSLSTMGESNSYSAIGSSIMSDIKDYEKLYSLDIHVLGLTPDKLNIKFWSNPNFGLNDSLIRNQIAKAFNYNSTTQEWLLTSDLEFFSIDPASCADTFKLTTKDYAVASTPAPEPSSMLFLGAMGIAGVLRSRRKKNIN